MLQLAINSVTEDVDLLYDCLIQLEQDKGLCVCVCVCVCVCACVCCVCVCVCTHECVPACVNTP